MPFLKLPKGAPPPSVADFAGMPLEAVGGPLGGLVGAGARLSRKVLPEGLGAALKGLLGRGAPVAENLASQTPDLVQSNPVKQVMPGMEDVDALIGQSRYNMAKNLPKPPAPPPAPRVKMYDPEAEYAQYLKNQATEDVERAAKLRGTPADMPSTPQGQQLEQRRRALEALMNSR